MMRQLPPLNALHVFEVVARHLSFQEAAIELDVTPTAVSHQIKVLESALGLPLIRRRPRPIALTEAGLKLYPVLHQSLGEISVVIDQLTRTSKTKELTVSVTPVFAAKWLVPRLSDFQRIYPEIDLRLHTSNDVVNLQQGTVDVAIRYGRGNYPGLSVNSLMTDTFMPVCSPRLLTQQKPLKHPDDLAHFPLLHFEWIHFGADAPNWKNWFEAAGIHSVDFNKGIIFDEESLAIQAAIAGQGVALCSSIHVSDDLALGILINPLDIVLSGFTYSAVYLENHSKKLLVQTFLEWVKSVASGL